jgi:hypothetical protein
VYTWEPSPNGVSFASSTASSSEPTRYTTATGPNSHDGGWELPVLGEVAAPTAMLVRHDGYVAWVEAGSDEGLVDALARWFGPASG